METRMSYKRKKTVNKEQNEDRTRVDLSLSFPIVAFDLFYGLLFVLEEQDGREL